MLDRALLKKIRKKKGYTQKKLGQLCNPPISESTIRKYELGILNPKYETVRRIADALYSDNYGIGESLWIHELTDDVFTKHNLADVPDTLNEYTHDIGEFLYYNPNHKPLFDSVMEVKTKDITLAKNVLDRINGKSDDETDINNASDQNLPE